MLRRGVAQGCGAGCLVCGHSGWRGYSSEAGPGKTDAEPDPWKRSILSGRRQARGTSEYVSVTVVSSSRGRVAGSKSQGRPRRDSKKQTPSCHLLCFLGQVLSTSPSLDLLIYKMEIIMNVFTQCSPHK